MTQQAERETELEEILITTDNYSPSSYITKYMKNKIYQIPNSLIPDMKTYEIEVYVLFIFWI